MQDFIEASDGECELRGKLIRKIENLIKISARGEGAEVMNEFFMFPFTVRSNCE